MELMIDSYTATYVIITFLFILCIILPILEHIPKIKDFISLRWILVAIYSAMCLGVILDFSHLDNSVRFAVVVGGIVLSAIFLLVRSIEKAITNNWNIPKIRSKLSKGDVQAELSVNPKLDPSHSQLNAIEDNDYSIRIDDNHINGTLDGKIIHRKKWK